MASYVDSVATLGLQRRPATRGTRKKNEQLMVNNLLPSKYIIKLLGYWCYFDFEMADRLCLSVENTAAMSLWRLPGLLLDLH